MDTEEPKMTEPRTYLQHELLTEIFQIIPSDVFADLYNLANALFYNFLKGTADRLATECPEKRREIQTVMDKYQISAEEKIDNVFNVFQQYISQSIWKIPDDLDLQFHQHNGIDFNIAPQDLQDADAQLDDLRKRIIVQKEFNVCLTHKFERKYLTVKRIDRIMENVAFLDEIPRDENVKDVNNTLLFVEEQIEKLRDAVIAFASENVSSIPENERSLYLRSRLKQWLEHHRKRINAQ